MSRLSTAQVSRHDPSAIARLAERAMTADREADVLPTVEAAARTTDDPRLWHWTGLLHRAIDRRDRALPAFERARRLRPADPVVAHADARNRLEAGLPAVEAFEAAHALTPLDGDVLLGLSSARLAAGETSAAIDGLATMCLAHPGWLAGHAELSRLRWVAGDRDGFVASYERAIATAPRDPALWRELIGALARAGLWDRTSAAIVRARTAIGDALFLDLHEATFLSECRELDAADAAFARIASVIDPSASLHRVRHALRSGRLEAAMAEIDRALGAPGGEAMWPYASIAWQLANDPRAERLHAEALVRVDDIAADLPPLDKLAALLDSLHKRGGEQFDQSVRGGSQTPGILLARIEPAILAVREAIDRAVSRYVAALPPVDPWHPTLASRRDAAVRLAGSWSVRLPAGGHHSSHVHSAGWISSALYVALPGAAGQPDGAGALVIGAPQAELGLAVPLVRRIEPKPGRLLLFPSWMWHGTAPFAATAAGHDAARLTIAFDVRRPKD